MFIQFTALPPLTLNHRYVIRYNPYAIMLYCFCTSGIANFYISYVSHLLYYLNIWRWIVLMMDVLFIKLTLSLLTEYSANIWNFIIL